MKYSFCFFLLLFMGGGCKPKIISGIELENKLKETVKEYLVKTLRPGTTVTVEDVTYYPEKSKNAYLCQFHVNMRSGKSDTTGIVAATISNDFSKVERTQ